MTFLGLLWALYSPRKSPLESSITKTLKKYSNDFPRWSELNERIFESFEQANFSAAVLRRFAFRGQAESTVKPVRLLKRVENVFKQFSTLDESKDRVFKAELRRPEGSGSEAPYL